MYSFSTLNHVGNESSIKINREQLFKIIKSVEKRDIHIIDEKYNFRISALIAKDEAILVKIDFIRCIITKNTAYFVNSGLPNSSFVKLIQKTRQDIMTNNGLFPFTVLESILEVATDQFDELISTLTPKVGTFNGLVIAKETINNREFVQIQRDIINLRYKVNDIYELLNNTSELDDNELSDFYLSLQHDDSDEFKKIIDNYKMHFEENSDDLNKMNESVKNTLTMLDLDYAAVRNDLARFDINLTILMIALAFANLISSVYGMNVINHSEESEHAFGAIIIVIVFLVIAIYFLTNYKFNKL